MGLIDQSFFLLAFFGWVIGIYSVLIGGGMFFSVPLLQWLCPELGFGGIISNLKMGSFFRGIGSTVSTFKDIDYPLNFKISILALIASMLGAYLISDISQAWMLPAVVLAVLLAIYAPRWARKFNRRSFHVSSFGIGAYAGVFGAGIGVLLIALIRLKRPDNRDIAHVKIQARFIEWLLIIAAISVHITYGNLVADIWIPYSMGAILGGIIGGVLLKKLGKLSGVIQKRVLYTSFAFAVSIALYSFLSEYGHIIKIN